MRVNKLDLTGDGKCVQDNILVSAGDNSNPKEQRIEADPDVIGFINAFYQKFSGDEEALRRQFRAGYCWHFAHMLKATFDRGEVCWAAPYGHFVWCDSDGTPYDVEGLYVGEADYFVPESYLGDALFDFKHIPGKNFNARIADLERILNAYLSPKTVRLVNDKYGGLTICINR